MSDIYNLYLSYVDREVDDKYINNCFEYLMEKENDLLPYIRDFSVTDENISNFGSYSNANKTIKINKNNINDNTIIAKNTLALEVVKHEIEHARNLQRLELLKKDIQSEVLFYALRSYAFENGLDQSKMEPIDRLLLVLNTNKNYKTNPGERIADIKAWKYVVNLLKNQNKTKELKDARVMLYCSYIRGYKDNRYYIECPTYDFLIKTNQLNEFKKLRDRVDKSNYSLDTRLLCGLPITNKEFNVDVLTKSRLQRTRTKK